MTKRCEFCAMTRTALAAGTGAGLVVGTLLLDGLLLLSAP
jgi:hypothetical protein